MYFTVIAEVAHTARHIGETLASSESFENGDYEVSLLYAEQFLEAR